MISVIFNGEKIQREIRTKISGMRKVLLEFADDESPLVNEIARATIFGGVGKASLTPRTGETQQAGLIGRRYSKLKGKSNFAGESFWSKATNIHDNFKERKKLGLLKALKREFEKDSRVNSIFNQAMDDFDRVGK
jgi:hypothetical protein